MYTHPAPTHLLQNSLSALLETDGSAPLVPPPGELLRDRRPTEQRAPGAT